MSKEKVAKTEEQKKEIKKNIVTGLIAVIAIAAIVCVIVFYFQKNGNPNSTKVIKQDVKSLDQIVTLNRVDKVPFVKTDIDGVVYTANSASEVTFYEFDSKQYNQIEETGSMDIQVPLSNQQISVKMHFVERDGKLTGFGVFTSDGSTDVYIYDFLLCKMTNLPGAYDKDGKCLLLVNTNIKDVYSDDPVWEEAYVLDRNNGTITRFLSENNRMLGKNGAVRSDFCMITDSEIKLADSAIPFFTSREYDTSDNAPIDIYVKNENKETLAVKNVADKYTKVLEDGSIICLKKTNGGFNTVKFLNGQESVVNSFYSQYGSQYIRSGDWILSKEDGRLYTTYDDTVYELPEFKINPTEFCVSPDGKYVVMAGTVTNAMDYQVYIYNTQSGKVKTFADKNYTAHKELRFINNTAITYYTVNGSGYETTILDVSKIS